MLGDLYTVPIEGGDATALTEDIAWNLQPRYSPDGSRIAFVSDRGGAGQHLGDERRRDRPRGRERGEGEPRPQPGLEPRRRLHRSEEGIHLDPLDPGG